MTTLLDQASLTDEQRSLITDQASRSLTAVAELLGLALPMVTETPTKARWWNPGTG